MIDIEKIAILRDNYILIEEIIQKKLDYTPYAIGENHTTGLLSIASRRYDYYACFYAEESNNILVYQLADIENMNCISTKRVIQAIYESMEKDSNAFDTKDTFILVFDVDDGERVIETQFFKHLSDEVNADNWFSFLTERLFDENIESDITLDVRGL